MMRAGRPGATVAGVARLSDAGEQPARPGGSALPYSAVATGGPQERSPGALAPGPLFPSGRFGQGDFSLFAQLRFHFLARNPRPGIIGGGLDAALRVQPTYV